MPYVVEHEASCKNRNRYRVRREVVVIEDKRGVVLDNSDRGKELGVQCESCKAPAVWK